MYGSVKCLYGVMLLSSKSIQERVSVVPNRERDKIEVYSKWENYRLTAYLRVSQEYKFPGWDKEHRVMDWFWEFADEGDISDLLKSALRESESINTFIKNRYMLKEEETRDPVKMLPVIELWSCQKCGSEERPEEKQKPSLCDACRCLAAQNGVLTREKKKKSA